MADIVEEIEFLYKMYKKSSNKEQFAAILRQLYTEQDFSTEAFEVMSRIVKLDQLTAPAAGKQVRRPATVPVAPPVKTTRAQPADDGCGHSLGGGVSRSC